MVAPPTPALRLLDFYTRVPAGSDRYEYEQVSIPEGNTAAVQLAYGDTKAEALLDAALKVATIQTIAVHSRFPRQNLLDSPLLSAFARLFTYLVNAKFEALSVSGVAGTDGMDGLITQSTAFVPSAGLSPADAISEGLANLQTVGLLAIRRCVASAYLAPD